MRFINTTHIHVFDPGRKPMNIYQVALDIQDACNPTAVVFAGVDILKGIMNEPGHTGTDAIKSHPAFVLFASKINAFVGGIGDVGSQDFSKAYAACLEKSGDPGTYIRLRDAAP